METLPQIEGDPAADPGPFAQLVAPALKPTMAAAVGRYDIRCSTPTRPLRSVRRHDRLDSER
jgi:hypothetical protein